MRKILLILCCLTFVQCESLFESDWFRWIDNNADHDIIFEFDVEDVGGKVYARNSYDDPPEFTIEFGKRKIYAHNSFCYDFFTYHRKDVKINEGDSVSVYVYHPDTLALYSWEEIKQGHKYWFKRIVIPGYQDHICFPFDESE